MGKMSEQAHFVVRAEDLPVLSDLPPGLPRPRRLEWINRGTDQPLRYTSVAMLLRTLFRDSGHSASVKRLHSSTGLRVVFQNWNDRSAFASAFQEAIRSTHKVQPDQRSAVAASTRWQG